MVQQKEKCHFFLRQKGSFSYDLPKSSLSYKMYIAFQVLVPSLLHFLVDTDTGLDKAKMKVLRNYYKSEDTEGDWKRKLKFFLLLVTAFLSSKRILLLHPPFLSLLQSFSKRLMSRVFHVLRAFYTSFEFHFFLSFSFLLLLLPYWRNKSTKRSWRKKKKSFVFEAFVKGKKKKEAFFSFIVHGIVQLWWKSL